MNLKKVVGVFLFLIGTFFLISSQSGMTGNVISERANALSSVFGLIFIIIGLILTIKRNLAQEVLDSRKTVDNTNELIRIAKQMGYNIREGYKKGSQITYAGSVLTTIPKHNKINSKTARGILKALARRESNFRKYD